MRSLYYVFSAMLLLAGNLSFAQCGTTNIALNQPASSSTWLGNNSPSKAVDADTTTTAWIVQSSSNGGAPFIYVDLGSTMSVCDVILDWDVAGVGRAFTIALSNDASNWNTVATVTGNVNVYNNLGISGAGRYVRLRITQSNGGGNYHLFALKVFGNVGCSSVNSALGKTATATHSAAGQPPSNAFDGNALTAWFSDNTTPATQDQKLTVDLGSIQPICSVGFLFDPAGNPKNYNVNLSKTGTIGSFTTAAAVTNNTSTNASIGVSGSARFVQFEGTTPGTPGGSYDIDEMTVSGPVITLPINLLEFTATNVNNQQVQLNWTTETETNNKTFGIERSADGVTYTIIGQVPGAINSSTALSYAWADDAPAKGKNFYRLQQVDLDGNSSYSNVNVVEIGGVLKLSVYPNPVKDVLTILNPGGLTIREIVVYNTSGVVLSKLAPSSTGTVRVSAGGWAAGLYLVKVITDQGSQVLKVMK